jgi:hypothetical protein
VSLRPPWPERTDKPAAIAAGGSEHPEACKLTTVRSADSGGKGHIHGSSEAPHGSVSCVTAFLGEVGRSATNLLSDAGPTWLVGNQVCRRCAQLG